MKKALSVTALLLAVILLAMCCVACGDDKKEETPETPDATLPGIVTPTEQPTNAPDPQPTQAAATLAGTYQIVSMTGVDSDAIAQYRDQISLVINADNTGSLNYANQSLTFTIDTAAMTVTTSEGETASYTFDGTNFSMTAPNGSMQVWEKKGSGSGSSASSSAMAGSYTLDSDDTYGTLVVYADNTGLMDDGEVTADCVFDAAGTITMTLSGQPLSGTYSFDGDTISITVNGVTLVFDKD